jgi:hypothetical protein
VIFFPLSVFALSVMSFKEASKYGVGLLLVSEQLDFEMCSE